MSQSWLDHKSGYQAVIQHFDRFNDISGFCRKWSLGKVLEKITKIYTWKRSRTPTWFLGKYWSSQPHFARWFFELVGSDPTKPHPEYTTGRSVIFRQNLFSRYFFVPRRKINFELQNSIKTKRRSTIFRPKICPRIFSPLPNPGTFFHQFSISKQHRNQTWKCHFRPIFYR